ncbi:MAG: hypothetical protein M1818_001402 [Claussenomyces sp. TS43310]|nr:MAG: hypothetical protein M1818_001402 [Claussenomyces sp. TS43310]
MVVDYVVIICHVWCPRSHTFRFDLKPEAAREEQRREVVPRAAHESAADAGDDADGREIVPEANWNMKATRDVVQVVNNQGGGIVVVVVVMVLVVDLCNQPLYRVL